MDLTHFESVAVVNKWDDITKLQWLHVRVAGKGTHGAEQS